MNLYQDIWVKDIQGNIFPENSFMAQSLNDDEFVDKDFVKLSHAGVKPGTRRNATTYPATINTRVDSITEYQLDNFEVLPIMVQDYKEVMVSYNKRQSVMMESMEQLQTDIANFMAWRWMPTVATNIIRTTGNNRPASAPSATGTRKMVTRADFRRMQELFNKHNIPQADRFSLLTAEMYSDLIGDDVVLSRDYMNNPNLQTGVIDKLYGINIMMRSDAIVCDAAAAVKTPSISNAPVLGAATDNAAALFWHKNFVRRAKGSVKVFVNEDVAEYYGTVISSSARASGSKARADQRGVYALVEQQ